MPLEEALKELKTHATAFTLIGDAKQAIKKDKAEFIHKWTKVMQYYKYVVSKSKYPSEAWFEAVDIISDISCDNPSLDEWVDAIVAAPTKKMNNTNNVQQDETELDTSSIVNQIESYISEIKNMQSWDTDQIKDIEWKLKEYKEILMSNKDSFESNLYFGLLNDIDASLAKIDKFYLLIGSDAMENLKKV